MGPTAFLLATLFLVSGGLPLVLASVVYEHRHKPGATGLLLLTGGICVWGVANALHTFAYTEGFAYAVWNVRAGGAAVTIVGWFLTVTDYTDVVRPRKRVVAPLLVIPAATQLFVWTNGAHHRYYGAETTFTAVESIVVNYGPAFYAHAFYLYALVVAAVVLLLAEIVDTAGIRRQQSLALFVSVLPPAALNIVHLVAVRSVDLTSFGFVVSVFVVGWALFYGQLLEVVPVARDNLVRGMTDAVVTLDAENRVVDANPAARELCGVDEGYVGTHGEEFFAEFPSLIERFGDVTEAKTEVSVEADGERRHFDLRITPVDGRRPAESGRLIVLREITERKRREQALREKNERLDQFANFVSHDLRNPLQVAAGHAALARESGDDEHIERVEGSLARMDEMIENLRTLTHADEDHVETTRLELEAAATDAWAGVDAAEARLVVETTCQIVADREFLLHTLENLFRNAVEHAGDAATVTVGCLDEGFYVADDGPGIPPEERDRVLEYGYTNSQDGTGIGLAIVRTVAEAHGWEITVTESDSGGARFEFAGPSAPAGEPSPTGQQTT